MREIRKGYNLKINIALIFILIGILVFSNLAYPKDISCLRPLIGIDVDRAKRGREEVEKGTREDLQMDPELAELSDVDKFIINLLSDKKILPLQAEILKEIAKG